eukprot:g61139.t1
MKHLSILMHPTIRKMKDIPDIVMIESFFHYQWQTQFTRLGHRSMDSDFAVSGIPSLIFPGVVASWNILHLVPKHVGAAPDFQVANSAQPSSLSTRKLANVSSTLAPLCMLLVVDLPFR